jgi:hypothetical protein
MTVAEIFGGASATNKECEMTITKRPLGWLTSFMSLSIGKRDLGAVRGQRPTCSSSQPAWLSRDRERSPSSPTAPATS